jgi:hypothetical protein
MTIELLEGMNDLKWCFDIDGYDIEIDPGTPPNENATNLFDAHGIPPMTWITRRGGIDGPVNEFRPYEMFPGLFMVFAETGDRPEDILAFISRHGFLEDCRAKAESLKETVNYQTAIRGVLFPFDQGDIEAADKAFNELWHPRVRMHASRVNPTRPSFRITPTRLIDLMVMQLGEYISGFHDFKRCEACGNPFRYKRQDAKTCSNACRQALKRQRKKEGAVK